LQYIASTHEGYVREDTENPLSACFARYQFWIDGGRPHSVYRRLHIGRRLGAARVRLCRVGCVV